LEGLRDNNDMVARAMALWTLKDLGSEIRSQAARGDIVAVRGPFLKPFVKVPHMEEGHKIS
jgi:hypothetical protein